MVLVIVCKQLSNCSSSNSGKNGFNNCNVLSGTLSINSNLSGYYKCEQLENIKSVNNYFTTLVSSNSIAEITECNNIINCNVIRDDTTDVFINAIQKSNNITNIVIGSESSTNQRFHRIISECNVISGIVFKNKLSDILINMIASQRIFYKTIGIINVKINIEQIPSVLNSNLYFFDNCDNINNINIHGNTTSNEILYNFELFKNCKVIDNIIFKKHDSHYLRLNYNDVALIQNSKVISNLYFQIKLRVDYRMQYFNLLEDIDEITNVRIWDISFISNNDSTDASLFLNINNLNNLNINNLEYSFIDINDDGNNYNIIYLNLFRNCNTLSNIRIADSVFSLHISNDHKLSTVNIYKNCKMLINCDIVISNFEHDIPGSGSTSHTFNFISSLNYISNVKFKLTSRTGLTDLSGILESNHVNNCNIDMVAGFEFNDVDYVTGCKAANNLTQNIGTHKAANNF